MQYFVSNQSILHDHYDNLYISLNSNTSIYRWRVEKGNSVIRRAYKGYREIRERNGNSKEYSRESWCWKDTDSEHFFR